MQAFFAKVDTYRDTIGTIVSAMDEGYEGGDFCAGLTVAYEVRKIGMEVVTSVI